MKNMQNYIKDYMQATYKIHFFLYCSYDYSLNFLKGNQKHVRSHCDWADSPDSPGAHYHRQLWNGWRADTPMPIVTFSPACGRSQVSAKDNCEVAVVAS